VGDVGSNEDMNPKTIRPKRTLDAMVFARRFMIHIHHWLIEVLKAALEGNLDSIQDLDSILF